MSTSNSIKTVCEVPIIEFDEKLKFGDVEDNPEDFIRRWEELRKEVEKRESFLLDKGFSVEGISMFIKGPESVDFLVESCNNKSIMIKVVLTGEETRQQARGSWGKWLCI
ncbi:hypothetical protein OCU04_005294 [Sclerotinia nivalis]|uniref:Uncharacterized protein n=1 Tax=Sclerotinia nivalis TaxID=352851 RepID=A0A9X0ANT7_9HELO|nr:hypothetical protein OCU04_005294 [Sclerotinia nivalis]